MALPSFRSRIRRTALILITGLLVLVGIGIYVGLHTLLHRHVDQELLALARAEAAWVEDQTGVLRFRSRSSTVPPRRGEGRGHDDDVDDEDEDDEHEHLREAARSIIIRSPEGAIIWTGEAARPGPPLDDSLAQTLMGGRAVFDTVRTASEAPTRRLSYPIQTNGRIDYILEVARPLGFVEEALDLLLILLGGISIGALAFAWIGSGSLARQALNPIETLSDTAAGISASTLNRTRAHLPTPYAEFHRLTSAFNGMLDRLQRVFDAQGRFVADASHELKTPLTAMKGHLEVALDRARTVDDHRETLLTMLSEVERLIALTRSLLTLVQFAGEKPPIQRTPLSMEPILREVSAELSVLAEERGIRLSVETDHTPRILGDAGRLKQMLINLVDNALRYTQPGGLITLALATDNERVRLSVSDTGSGIAPEHLPRLFEPFYRPDAARDKEAGGAGLGLALVKEIAEAHGGKVRAESTPGEGSRFLIWIPALRD